MTVFVESVSVMIRLLYLIITGCVKWLTFRSRILAALARLGDEECPECRRKKKSSLATHSSSFPSWTKQRRSYSLPDCKGICHLRFPPTRSHTLTPPKSNNNKPNSVPLAFGNKPPDRLLTPVAVKYSVYTKMILRIFLRKGNFVEAGVATSITSPQALGPPQCRNCFKRCIEVSVLHDLF